MSMFFAQWPSRKLFSQFLRSHVLDCLLCNDQTLLDFVWFVFGSDLLQIWTWSDSHNFIFWLVSGSNKWSFKVEGRAQKLVRSFDQLWQWLAEKQVLLFECLTCSFQVLSGWHLTSHCAWGIWNHHFFWPGNAKQSKSKCSRFAFFSPHNHAMQSEL